MIERISIKNLALLEEAHIDFSSGFTVFSGETGAGKSLLISSLELLTGVRASKEQVRTEAKLALVEADFSRVNHLLPKDLQASLVRDGIVQLNEDEDFPEDISLSREININSKSYARINGRAVSLQRLKEVGAYLIDIHSQREQATLFNEENHLSFLDIFGGEDIAQLLASYQKFYRERRSLLKQRQELGGQPELRNKERDLLEYQIEELEQVSVKEREDERLMAKLKILRNSAKVNQLVASSLNSLRESENSIEQQLADLHNNIDILSEYDKSWDEQVKNLLVVEDLLLDLTANLDKALDMSEYKPELISRIEERIERLNQLKRKYGGSLDSLLEYLEKSKKRLAFLKGAEEELRQVDKKLHNNKRGLEKTAEDLSKKRKEIAKGLEIAIEKQLKDLSMTSTQLVIDFSQVKKYSVLGKDKPIFTISTNLGEDFKPLAKIASGGEASRIMLALKVVLTSGQEGASLVFDEVDTGVGGAVCGRIAEKLMELSIHNQCFCVTHSASIAATAEEHYLIYKEELGSRTYTRIKALSAEEKQVELARLLAGQENANIAQELIEDLQDFGNDYRAKLQAR